MPKTCPFLEHELKLFKYFIIKHWNIAFLFTSDKQHVCEEQETVLAVPRDIAVNFTNPKFSLLKSRKSGKLKCLNFSCIISFHCWRQVEIWHDYPYIVGQ